MIRRVLVVMSLVGYAVCLMCYQCADSSEKKGKNDCQTYVRTMRKYQRQFLESGHMGRYVKNCSEFAGLPENETYCYIATVEAEGEIRSYIRDCSDGKNFFGPDISDLFTQESVNSDNETTCSDARNGYVACVTMCGPRQDFCNGPTASAAWNKVSVLLVLLSLINMFLM